MITNLLLAAMLMAANANLAHDGSFVIDAQSTPAVWVRLDSPAASNDIPAEVADTPCGELLRQGATQMLKAAAVISEQREALAEGDKVLGEQREAVRALADENARLKQTVMRVAVHANDAYHLAATPMSNDKLVDRLLEVTGHIAGDLRAFTKSTSEAEAETNNTKAATP